MNSKKSDFRKQIKPILAKVLQSQINQESLIVAQKIFQLEIFKNAKNISVFLSMPQGELNTSLIVSQSLKDSKSVYVPCCSKDEMKMLKIEDLDDYNSLPKNSWLIPEPSLNDGRDDSLDISLDLIIVPGLAFDKSGKRIGYGKGYYDKFLAKTFENQKKLPATIAVCLTAQIVDEVPSDELDIKPDMIITADS